MGFSGNSRHLIGLQLQRERNYAEVASGYARHTEYSNMMFARRRKIRRNIREHRKIHSLYKYGEPFVEGVKLIQIYYFWFDILILGINLLGE